MYEEIYKKIKEECTFRNFSAGSIKQYIYHASCFLKWIGDKPLFVVEKSAFLTVAGIYQKAKLC